MSEQRLLHFLVVMKTGMLNTQVVAICTRESNRAPAARVPGPHLPPDFDEAGWQRKHGETVDE
jgi:hypothetical protein